MCGGVQIYAGIFVYICMLICVNVYAYMCIYIIHVYVWGGVLWGISSCASVVEMLLVATCYIRRLENTMICK